MKGKMDKKSIRESAIRLEKMIEKYGDYVEVQQIKDCYTKYIDMAKKEKIIKPFKNVSFNPYWFTDTDLVGLNELEFACAEFRLRITLDDETYKAFFEDE
ncbi:hypothetical protein [Pasteurella atlantica]|uniref:hypothetical protein n=1 Tax=Pasteurellaceae TaxID=712 RepID=UPI002745119A|nr:hypothetical protein [Pasteurella atlantica]MDP8099881.1 hypothetical protein [Pasteurella atlantica]MDP8107727.1 hypothetical protein [Pasteurella atlantica]MDP8117504.1 hypothetical protein [Pasteurella atlantica]